MSGDRNQLRQVFFEVWRKHQSGEVLEPLEEIVSSVVMEHPEYHAMLNDREKLLVQEFHPEGGESNPFLHMAIHISLMEQVTTDRPTGISGLYRRLCQRMGEEHEAEHQLMECLGRMLWEAQSANKLPDEQAYLDCIKLMF
ncbi:MAG: DUF1841 family protein [Candidatus Thiodiazotropha sp. (ex Lucinoma aequizonata)]|nr:DUF1841 family protein [Candidatus Thiodiazotropha sp. (ex Lucinoma aequizonata)]MCU7889387.1 DUF1841 family protein [Candidatus Thiodiazotropha sp. (ex Lucinoma aequizonata)]MCU7894966.1 DUF1841 family protein [Candidatus Thiodiazotropha sp. (ex Lucinoma aequizonata)]MCU7897874.1 DUF1841 family protein [Candidatus Thiodiazotropha sp. (ex Lucinoma aequizonata)]MCU7904212.1 DUF1841 family protein [Candidatus Thiodiazotropha sp. (ex Lucinoma aequizonata)]